MQAGVTVLLCKRDYKNGEDSDCTGRVLRRLNQ
jgi:hypothetical protein